MRAPSVAFVRRERVEAVGEVERYWPGAPDLTLEVVSPNDRFAEVEEKVPEWPAAGARTVFVVNPRAKTVTIRPFEKGSRIPSEAEAVDGGGVVPGWRIPVADGFR